VCKEGLNQLDAEIKKRRVKGGRRSTYPFSIPKVGGEYGRRNHIREKGKFHLPVGEARTRPRGGKKKTVVFLALKRGGKKFVQVQGKGVGCKGHLIPTQWKEKGPMMRGGKKKGFFVILRKKRGGENIYHMGSLRPKKGHLSDLHETGGN